MLIKITAVSLGAIIALAPLGHGPNRSGGSRRHYAGPRRNDGNT